MRLLAYDDRVEETEVAEPFATLADPRLPASLDGETDTPSAVSSGAGSNEVDLVGLVGSLWNRDTHARLQRLARKIASGEGKPKPTQPTFRRRRPRVVLMAIMAVLAEQPDGMQVRDVAVAVSTRLDGPVSKASIKSCLWAHAQGDGCFEQLGRGRYRLRSSDS